MKSKNRKNFVLNRALNLKTRRTSVFVPGHISGFFQVCDQPSEIMRKGSRNCGPCLDLGVLTEVELEQAEVTRVKVFINGELAPKALTSLKVARAIISKVGEPVEVKLDHRAQVPVGAGYGASGAGALGAAFALSKALGLRLPRDRLIAVAHTAEVTCRTGLGDVGAQALGGLVVGIQPGPPPYGQWRRIPSPQNLKVVCATLAPLSTKDLLRDEDFKRRARNFGGHAIRRLMEHPTLERFIFVSRDFAEKLGLLDNELWELIRTAEDAGAIGASQVMLGRSVFALVKKSKLEAVRDAFLDLLEPRKVMIASVDQKGVTLLSSDSSCISPRFH